MNTQTHARVTISNIDTEQKRKNKVQEAADAERLFSEERFDECANKCYEVLRAEPSEAILGKCHMFLATEAVGPEQASGRAYHAAMAIQMWNTVIERTGSSRFPVDRAKVQLAFTRKLFDDATALADEQDGPLPDGEGEEEGDQEVATQS